MGCCMSRDSYMDILQVFVPSLACPYITLVLILNLGVSRGCFTIQLLKCCVADSTLNSLARVIATNKSARAS